MRLITKQTPIKFFNVRLITAKKFQIYTVTCYAVLVIYIRATVKIQAMKSIFFIYSSLFISSIKKKYFFSIWEQKSFDYNNLFEGSLSNVDEHLTSDGETLNHSFRSKLNDNASNLNQIESVLGLHSNQIFLGMVSMQYKAKIVKKNIY